jgi:hypothetical protein
MADLIEIVQFRVARGIDEKTFSEASYAAQFLFTQASGFVNRELIRTGNGLNWIDIVRWRSIGGAEHAARSAVKDPQYKKFFGFIKKSSVKTVRMEHTRLYH